MIFDTHIFLIHICFVMVIILSVIDGYYEI